MHESELPDCLRSVEKLCHLPYREQILQEESALGKEVIEFKPSKFACATRVIANSKDVRVLVMVPAKEERQPESRRCANPR